MDDDEILTRALEIVRERSEARRPPALTVQQLYEPYKRAKSKVKSWPTIEIALAPVLEFLGARPVMSLTVADTEDYREQRRTHQFRHSKGRTVSDKTINYQLGWLKCMCTWGVRGGRIPHNPIAAMRAAKVSKHRKTSPTEDEIGRLLAHADVIMRGFILMAADSGMRRDEIRLCQWDWIDESTKLLTLPAASTKSQRERRVPVTARTFAALRLLSRHLKSPYVFHNANKGDGSPYHFNAVDRTFRAIVEASGIQAAPGDVRVHLHDLRHSFARRAARAGVRVEVISMILGHAHIQQTMAYLQTGDDDVIDALDTFEAALRRPAHRSGPIPDVGKNRPSIVGKNNNP